MENKKQTDTILGHIISRLTDNEIATSDIKDMLIKLNSTMNEIVEILDVVMLEEATLEDFDRIKNIKSKKVLVEYVISDYFKKNSKEAKELYESLIDKKVLFVKEVGES
ncbi:MAG TPA: hypothetical protein DCM40_30175 [Maribacter sp.]|jgi:type IV secretory pathway VirB4 component|nr:hypothetical protein [Maribacter sp.]